MSSNGGLLADVDDLVKRAVHAYAGTPQEQPLRELSLRIREPLRVAIAGRVKAGKSTLLNALVGQELAPTDAGESTRIITWYRNGITYRATLYPEGGDPVDVPFAKDAAGVYRVDLAGYEAEQVARLVIDWPSRSLVQTTLIDTPGIASMTASSGERTMEFLTPGDEGPTAADAVLYLMRHVHRTDVRFLEAFHDEEVSQATPINAVGVLSRADEIGAARTDAMQTAERIAARYRADPALQRLCQTVVPVSALIAEAGATLTQQEFASLAQVASQPQEALDTMLLSVDRFVAAEAMPGLEPRVRQRLLQRMGLFGVRLSVALLRSKAVRNAPELATRLVDASGLAGLRAVLSAQITARRDALKARSALLGLRAALSGAEVPASGELAREMERIESGAHEFAEIRLQAAMRAGEIKLRDDDVAAAERLLAGGATSIAERLGLPEEAPPAEVRAALASALGHWQRLAESPMAGPGVIEAARVLVRSCEGLFTRLADTASA